MPKAWCLRAIVGHSAVIRGLRRPTDASEALSPKNGANSVNWGRWRERWRYGDIPNPSEERKSPTEIYLKLFNNEWKTFFRKKNPNGSQILKSDSFLKSKRTLQQTPRFHPPPLAFFWREIKFLSRHTAPQKLGPELKSCFLHFYPPGN